MAGGTWTGTVSAAVAVAIGLAVSGCSTSDQPPLGTVRGKVTLDGQPLAGAIVVFSPVAEGRQSFAETSAEGEYELIYFRDTRGAIVGRHTVRITTANEESPDERVPARYNAETTLTFDVKPGRNNAPPFELTSD